MPTPTESADAAATTMFRNLSTSTKLILLCGAFIVAIAVAIYTLVAQQQIAIEFSKKELTGVHYIEAVRGVYSRLLGEPESNPVSAPALPSAETVLSSLSTAEAGANFNTASLEQSLATTLRRLWSESAEEGAKTGLVGEALVKARDLISRVGDDFEPRARSRSRQLLFARHVGKTDAASARPDRRYTRADWHKLGAVAVIRRQDPPLRVRRDGPVHSRGNRKELDLGLSRRFRGNAAAEDRGADGGDAVQRDLLSRRA